MSQVLMLISRTSNFYLDIEPKISCFLQEKVDIILHFFIAAVFPTLQRENQIILKPKQNHY